MTGTFIKVGLDYLYEICHRCLTLLRWSLYLNCESQPWEPSWALHLDEFPGLGPLYYFIFSWNSLCSSGCPWLMPSHLLGLCLYSFLLESLALVLRSAAPRTFCNLPSWHLSAGDEEYVYLSAVPSLVCEGQICYISNIQLRAQNIIGAKQIFMDSTSKIVCVFFSRAPLAVSE